MRKYIDHHKTMHAKALQRSKYMCLDNDVGDQNKFTENVSDLREFGPSA